MHNRKKRLTGHMLTVECESLRPITGYRKHTSKRSTSHRIRIQLNETCTLVQASELEEKVT